VDNDEKTGLTYKVHIGIDQHGIDHISPVISDAHDAVTKAWRLRNPRINARPLDHEHKHDDDARFAELTRQTLQAVCARSGIAFRLHELPRNVESKAHTTMSIDQDVTKISRQSTPTSSTKVDLLAKSDWSLKGTIDLPKLTSNLDHAASCLEAGSQGEPVAYGRRSLECAQATAAVLELICELKPNAIPRKQWGAMKKWKDVMSARSLEQLSDHSQVVHHDGSISE